MDEGRLLLLISFFILLQTASCSPLFEPIVLIWPGDIPGYGEALESIVSETGTKTILVRSEDVLRGLINLPQVRCVILATFTPPDYDFLEEFSPVLQKHFEEGGSFIGIGPVCSSAQLESLATTIFPIEGNSTKMGRKIDDMFGSIYVESETIDEISSGLPSEFPLIQFQCFYHSSPGGRLDPRSESGTATVLYRDKANGIAQVVALERDEGGRSVSFPGCFIATIERLPYYWEKLLSQEEFKLLLEGSVSWAMAGSSRYQRLALDQEERLLQEADSISEARKRADSRRKRERFNRLILLAGAWSIGLLVDAFLVIRYVVPKVRG